MELTELLLMWHIIQSREDANRRHRQHRAFLACALGLQAAMLAQLLQLAEDEEDSDDYLLDNDEEGLSDSDCEQDETNELAEPQLTEDEGLSDDEQDERPEPAAHRLAISAGLQPRNNDCRLAGQSVEPDNIERISVSTSRKRVGEPGPSPAQKRCRLLRF
jgi:hypothetical protein